MKIDDNLYYQLNGELEYNLWYYINNQLTFRLRKEFVYSIKNQLYCQLEKDDETT